jgi:hypothetical protein
LPVFFDLFEGAVLYLHEAIILLHGEAFLLVQAWECFHFLTMEAAAFTVAVDSLPSMPSTLGFESSASAMGEEAPSP